MSTPWQQRQQQARQELAALSFLVGDWVGAGHSEGAAMTGRLTATMQLSETFLEVRERLFRADGALDHEDICIYRYDASQEQLRVLQMVAPAWTAERPVVPITDGLRWFDGPLGPQVALRMDGDDLLVTVTLPGADAPMLSMRYRRA